MIISDILGAPAPLIMNLQHVEPDTGGSSAVGYKKRNLNTLVSNKIADATFDGATHTFKLPAGTYAAYVYAILYFTSAGQTVIKESGTNNYVIEGCNVFGKETEMTLAPAFGIFTANSTKTYELGHICSNAHAAGFGENPGQRISAPCIFADVFLEQLT